MEHATEHICLFFPANVPSTLMKIILLHFYFFSVAYLENISISGNFFTLLLTTWTFLPVCISRAWSTGMFHIYAYMFTFSIHIESFLQLHTSMLSTSIHSPLSCAQIAAPIYFLSRKYIF